VKYEIILAVVLAAIVPLTLIMGWLSHRDKRMEKAQAAWQDERMRRAEAGYMPAIDRALWIEELNKGENHGRD
jgi:hypothetical protein